MKMIATHPPSPPQSTDGATPEPHRNPCGTIHSLYNQGNILDAATMHGDPTAGEIAYDGGSQASMGYNPSAYSQSLPLHSAQIITNNPQVETPPPTSDEDFLRGSSQSTPSQWLSPPARTKTRSKAKITKGPKSRAVRQKNIVYPRMPGPLSELTKHMTQVPIRDMEVWVHRPIEVRQQEVAKKKGKVARPMNSFMLYRSAYAERAKQWFAQNNHQVVSRMAGQSWKLELPEIRKRYELLARMEKANHERAHPGYRFAPEKDKKKRCKSAEENDSLKCSETPPKSSPSLNHIRTVGSEMGSEWDSRDSTPFGVVDHELSVGGAYFNSPWQSGTPGKPAPGMMSSPEPQYLQQSVHPVLLGSHVEDVRSKKIGMQDVQYTTSTALAGLPGAAHHELLQPQTIVPAPGSGSDGQLDPQLLGYHGDVSNGGGHVYSNSHYSVWQETPAGNCYLPVATTLSPTAVSYIGAGYQSGLSTLAESREAWEPSTEGVMDTAGEFDNWINSHPSGY
ncbi:hypothetical protein EYZ11_009650 [Aspergillus tanneri]|uniref:HMG box domain-containing protein n=1 Tax=Aspergillus tanneri TaxID=1220188 RepID=A0A4S3J7M1_9EURO|nr:uncharacterized protein ATNIH1004_008802 [Aspergillus tanneri]KAA8644596.1 hypothetical protein ATNIH1004_008802 [Aspergillus tanneri]THC90885.1 hypothetical protein EYZ11_009650 [Aspergillus tanneri]